MANDGKDALLAEIETVLSGNARLLLTLLDEEHIGPLEEQHERLKSERDRLLLLGQVARDTDYADAVQALQDAGREIGDAQGDLARIAGVTEALAQAAARVATVA